MKRRATAEEHCSKHFMRIMLRFIGFLILLTVQKGRCGLISFILTTKVLLDSAPSILICLKPVMVGSQRRNKTHSPSTSLAKHAGPAIYVQTISFYENLRTRRQPPGKLLNAHPRDEWSSAADGSIVIISVIHIIVLRSAVVRI